MSIFTKKKKGGLSDIIRCDETDYLVWKWHPNGANQGELKRESAIRTNSILRVKAGEAAVFFYKQSDNTIMDFVEGPFDEKIKTRNFPVLSSLIGLWYEGDTPFQAEIYFINIAKSLQIRFGVPYFDVADPRFPDFIVPVSVRGTLTFNIKNYKDFISNHQLALFSLDELNSKIQSAVIRYIKESVTNAPAEYGIPVIILESKLDFINERVENFIKDRLSELFSINVTGLDISSIDIDKESESYIELKKITKDISTSKFEADILNYQEELRIKREESQYAQRMSTRQTNIGAYQTEISGSVGIAGAEALGKMGENGVGNIELGNQGTGFNPVSMMAGMAVGSAVGKNIVDVLDQSTHTKEIVQNIPPNIPITKYYVAKDGKPTGPFDVTTLKSMISSGDFESESLVWKEGMSEWQKANLQSELIQLFPPKL